MPRKLNNFQENRKKLKELKKLGVRTEKILKEIEKSKTESWISKKGEV